MATGSLNLVLERIRRLAGGEGWSDAELLERFAARHEPAVFEVLVQRHGPTVLGVCRRVLRHEQDAEDVFQATFLVLARRAGSIRRHASLGSWLYGVAYRLALKVKARESRRRDHERRCAEMARSDPPNDAAWDELRPVLDQVLHRLPEKYRAPLVLCYLEGKTHAEAAGALGWPTGSMSRRLARALERLRAGLLRQGVALPAGVLATLLAERARAAVAGPLAQASCRAAVLAATGQVVTTVVSTHAAALAEGVMHTMLATKLKIGGALLATAAAVAVATALAGPGQPRANENPAPQDEPKTAPVARAPVDAPAELANVPGGTIGFARIAVRDIWTSDAMKKVREHPERAKLEILTQADKNLGVPIDNIEAVTLLMLNPDRPQESWPLAVVFSTTRPYSRDAVRAALAPKARIQEYKNNAYYATGDDAPVAVHFVSDRQFILSSVPTLKRYFDDVAAGGKPEHLAGALKQAERKHAVVAGFRWPDGMIQEVKRQPPPPQMAFLMPLFDMRSAELTVDINTEASARARLQFASADQAEQGKDAVQTGVGILKPMLAAIPAEARKDPLTSLMVDEAAAALKSVKLTRQDKAVEVAFHTKASFPLETVLPGIARARESANRMRSANNLKQMALAMHNYNAVYNRFPPAAIRSKDGKPLLSWRVAILPFIDKDALYKEFHLDEPWDSEHNKKLQEKMPKVYLPLNVEPQPGMTFYQVFTGKGTTFDNPKGVKILDVTDGTSNTILIVEGANAVPWTKPEDLPYDRNQPLPKLGGEFPDSFPAAFCDGSVRFLPRNLPEQQLRAMITRNGGEVVEWPKE